MGCPTNLIADIINDCTARPIKGVDSTAWVIAFKGRTYEKTDNVITSLTAPIGMYKRIEAHKFGLNVSSELVSHDVKNNGYIHKFSGTIPQAGNKYLDNLDGIIVVCRKKTGEWIVLGLQNGLWKTSQTRTANDNSGFLSFSFESRADMEEDYSEYTYDTTEQYLLYGENGYNFVFEGNSRTSHDRYGSTAGFEIQFPSYPEQLMAMSNFNHKGLYNNVATWGQTNSVILAESRYNTLVKPLRPFANGGSTGINEAYLFIMTGILDVILTPATVNTQIANYKAYCDRAKADGFKVVVVAEFYGQNTTFSQTAENARLAYNQAMADYATAGNIEMFVDLDPIIGLSTAAAWYADTTFHLKAIGKAMIAEYINSLFD